MVVVNSYSGYKYNIFYRKKKDDGTEVQIMMGIINLVGEMFSVDLYENLGVFTSYSLAECLQFFEDVGTIFDERIEDKKYDIVNLNDKHSYYYDANDLYMKFKIFGFTKSFEDSPKGEKAFLSFIKIYGLYLSAFSGKLRQFYA